MDASQGVCADCSDGGGANTHKPGAGGPWPKVALTLALRPAFARRASISAAAACPTAIPRAVTASAGSAAIAAAYFVAKTPLGSPRKETSVVYEAAISAAWSEPGPACAAE